MFKNKSIKDESIVFICYFWGMECEKIFLICIIEKTNLCRRTNVTFAYTPTHKANASAKAKEPFFNQRFKNNLCFAI